MAGSRRAPIVVTEDTSDEVITTSIINREVLVRKKASCDSRRTKICIKLYSLMQVMATGPLFRTYVSATIYRVAVLTNYS